MLNYCQTPAESQKEKFARKLKYTASVDIYEALSTLQKQELLALLSPGLSTTWDDGDTWNDDEFWTE